jgi:hypothetical protein
LGSFGQPLTPHAIYRVYVTVQIHLWHNAFAVTDVYVPVQIYLNQNAKIKQKLHGQELRLYCEPDISVANLIDKIKLEVRSSYRRRLVDIFFSDSFFFRKMSK